MITDRERDMLRLQAKLFVRKVRSEFQQAKLEGRDDATERIRPTTREPRGLAKEQPAEETYGSERQVPELAPAESELRAPESRR